MFTLRLYVQILFGFFLQVSPNSPLFHIPNETSLEHMCLFNLREFMDNMIKSDQGWETATLKPSEATHRMLSSE